MPAVTERELLTRLAAALSAELRLAGVDHVLTGSLVAPTAGRPERAGDPDLGVVVPSIRELRSVFEVASRHGFVGEDRKPVSRVAAKFHAAMRRGPLALDVVVPVLPFHTVIVRCATQCEVAGVALPLVMTDELAAAKLR